MATKPGDTVKIHYTGKLADGSVFDSSEGKDPLEFKLGEDMVIPGLEKAMIDMEVGDQKTVTIPTAEAYGDRKTELLFEVKKDSVPPDVELEVGLALEIRQESGDTFQVTVSEMSEDTITLDANHPFAGKDLTFDIELVEVNPGS